MTKVRFEQRPEGAETMAAEMKNADAYYRWTVSQFLPYLGQNILDIGGGYGAHLVEIVPKFPRVTSVELSSFNVEYMRQRFSAYSNFRAFQVDFGKDDIKMLTDEAFDSIICLNVLEHIEEDTTALADMKTILRGQNGTVCIQVPALQWLYGTIDEQAGHYRRYTKRELRDKLQQAGFEIVKIYYFNVFGVIPWYMSARIFKRSLQADSLNLQIKIFNALVPFMRRAEKLIRPPLGQSVMAIAKVK